MSRREAREAAFAVLYQLNFRQEPVSEQKALYLEVHPLDEQDLPYFNEITDGVFEKKDELEQKISKLTRQERHLRKELEDMINLLADPDEQGVLEMRYIDTQGWEPIAFSLFGMLDEYEDNPERYMKRTFRVHGEALQHLAAVFPPGSTASLP